jgi:hypothetical protein
MSKKELNFGFIEELLEMLAAHSGFVQYAGNFICYVSELRSFF